MKHTSSTNSERDPYFRDDKWEHGKNGHFGWLWKKWKDHPKVIAQLNRIAKQAKRNKQRSLP